MNFIYAVIALLILLSDNFICAGVEKVEQNSNLKINAVRSIERIVIDGKLDEKIWQRQGISELIQQDPDQGFLRFLFRQY